MYAVLHCSAHQAGRINVVFVCVIMHVTAHTAMHVVVNYVFNSVCVHFT